jgi:hypothetical protein
MARYQDLGGGATEYEVNRKFMKEVFYDENVAFVYGCVWISDRAMSRYVPLLFVRSHALGAFIERRVNVQLAIGTTLPKLTAYGEWVLNFTSVCHGTGYGI